MDGCVQHKGLLSLGANFFSLEQKIGRKLVPKKSEEENPKFSYKRKSQRLVFA